MGNLGDKQGLEFSGESLPFLNLLGVLSPHRYPLGRTGPPGVDWVRNRLPAASPNPVIHRNGRYNSNSKGLTH